MKTNPLADGFASAAMIVASLMIIVYMQSRRPVPVVDVTPYQAGDSFDLLADPALRTQRVLVLWLHSQCRYCTASLPFYRRLAERQREGVRLVAMGRESTSSIEAYLGTNGVAVDAVYSTPKGGRLVATPTLVLLEPGLQVRAVWTGWLADQSEQDEVIAVVFNNQGR